ncbi:hypothetical protein [Paraburkholderia kururiensis]|nr:hypothetical protein [Paraburkholderia kururiensis]
MIEGIAFQPHILALNTAVETACAGWQVNVAMSQIADGHAA